MPSPPDTAASPVVLDRREGPYGEVVLRRRGERFEIIANGCFLMDTSDGRSERLLVDAALEALDGDGDRGRTSGPDHTPDRNGDGDRTSGPDLLIGGLGVGFSLARAAAEPRWGRIAVVEREDAVVAWHRTGPLARFSAHALDDPRVRVLHQDLVAYVRTSSDTYDALCLDIDNGPDWTVTENNDSLYTPSGLAACRGRLRPGGVLAVWSAQPSAAFETALRDAGFDRVRTIEIQVARGVPDVVHIAVTA
ncbi:spermidine synthase [Actinacidiphila sp. ITFR-21]|uniref:spermidine synthase n=1 Tax=Actinacidiphila sp. ITFR-21 TaxID=3075199 RepID=UPI00288A0CE4|nr:spermidine synthase [Streptomyces sp. ITFR-21]WNI17948.1 spermidine synthase [Streptomyces sp. ITFR-21]